VDRFFGFLGDFWVVLSVIFGGKREAFDDD
jgi:hypothetical protein